MFNSQLSNKIASVAILLPLKSINLWGGNRFENFINKYINNLTARNISSSRSSVTPDKFLLKS